jgi:hypothetical protein
MTSSLSAAAALIVLGASVPVWGQSTSVPSACEVSGKVVRLSELPEASGVAASRRTPGVFWAHNDSADALLFALDDRGAIGGRVRVAGAKVDDWEDVAVGPCPQGSCVYIADIGDNSGRRDRITVYRTPEPAPRDASTQQAEVFDAAYPDGPHDAEALFVTPNADVFIITKGDPGPIALYRFPRPLQTGTIMRLERVGAPATDAKTVDSAERPTAADASQDGQWVAVRTTRFLTFYRTADLIAGRWREMFRTDLSKLREPRGEGIAFAADGAVVLVGEGGVLAGSGTFARITCTLRP